MVTDALSSLFLSMALAAFGILIAGALALLWDVGALFLRRHARGSTMPLLSLFVPSVCGVFLRWAATPVVWS
jgi:hypothetical protein